MTYWKKNDFERIERGALIKVGNWNNTKRQSKIYIVNKKGNEEGGMEWEKGSILY